MSDDDLDGLVTPQSVSALRLLTLALTLGALSFLAVILFLHFTGPREPPQGDAGLLVTLSLVHAAMLLASGVGAALLPRLLLARGEGAALRPAEAFGRVRAARLVRVVVLEGAALMGLAVCLVAVTSGHMRAQPVLWLNTLSTAVLLVAVLAGLPSREALTDDLRELLRR